MVLEQLNFFIAFGRKDIRSLYGLVQQTCLAVFSSRSQEYCRTHQYSFGRSCHKLSAGEKYFRWGRGVGWNISLEFFGHFSLLKSTNACCGLRVTGFELRVTGYGLRVTGCELRVACNN